jgi:hypothetical protein
MAQIRRKWWESDVCQIALWVYDEDGGVCYLFSLLSSARVEPEG